MYWTELENSAGHGWSLYCISLGLDFTFQLSLLDETVLTKNTTRTCRTPYIMEDKPITLFKTGKIDVAIETSL